MIPETPSATLRKSERNPRGDWFPRFSFVFAFITPLLDSKDTWVGRVARENNLCFPLASLHRRLPEVEMAITGPGAGTARVRGLTADAWRAASRLIAGLGEFCHPGFQPFNEHADFAAG